MTRSSKSGTSHGSDQPAIKTTKDVCSIDVQAVLLARVRFPDGMEVALPVECKSTCADSGRVTINFEGRDLFGELLSGLAKDLQAPRASERFRLRVAECVRWYCERERRRRSGE